MNSVLPQFSDAEILAARPPRNVLDPDRPYAYFVEPERAADGRVLETATIFLTNRECPFRCLMCDLWKNTTEATVPPGAIVRQIDFALGQLSGEQGVRTLLCEATKGPSREKSPDPFFALKLYNSGNFFDPRAIPKNEHAEIARRVRGFETVIVENHPRLCGNACVRFRDLLGTQLEIALGLETVHPDVLPALNKQMTVDDFDRAVQFLIGEGMSVRAFVLLRPPFLSDEEGIVWAVRSVEHAFSVGVGCCSVIPTRAGNGMMERLEQQGLFTPPSLRALEQTLEIGIGLGKGRVFVDLWDAERFCNCPRCGPQRIERLRRMNLLQELIPPVACDCGT